MKLKYCLFIFALASFSSCISNQELLYFQNSNLSKESARTFKNKNMDYRLRAGDVLSIRIKGRDIEYTSYLNKEESNGFNPLNEAGLYVNGFSIDTKGNIYLPNIGEIYVSGKTIQEVREEIQTIVSQKIQNASVFVSLISFKISVLGEVARPGFFYIYNDQTTLLEGLALGGDMLEFADRKRIHLIRRVPDGSEAILLDLTDPSVITSKYFYLQPNDVIYVPPLEIKSKRSNLANTQIINVALTAVGTAISAGFLYLSLKDQN